MKTALILLSVATVASGFAPQGAQRASSRLFEAAVEESTSVGAADISGLTSEVKTIFTSEDIDKLLPHRYPFALVDKVVEYEAGKVSFSQLRHSYARRAMVLITTSFCHTVLRQRAVGIKCVTKNEEFFQGHFPERPIMPGVLQVEALAQLAGIVSLQMEGASPGAVFFFAGVDGVKWKKPVVPGDTLVMEIKIKKWNKKFGLAKATGRAYVDGEMVVEVDEMTFALAK